MILIFYSEHGQKLRKLFLREHRIVNIKHFLISPRLKKSLLRNEKYVFVKLL